jgi:hypothetical protein
MTLIPKFDRKNDECKKFIKKLETEFINGAPIRIDWKNYDELFLFDLRKYISNLYKELERKARKKALSTNSFIEFQTQYARFKDSYSVNLRWGVYEYFVDFLLEQDQNEDAITEWINLQEEESSGSNIRFSYRDSSIDRLIQFEQICKRGIINGYHIDKIALKGNQLTEFGKRNINDVFMVIDTIINSLPNSSFFEQFYCNYTFENDGQLYTFPLEYYEQFFLNNSKSKKTWDWYNTSIGKTLGNSIDKFGNASDSFVKVAIREKASTLLREGENEYRNNIGAKRIGEAWISETELYYKIKNALPAYEVIHHGKPHWLGRQHFDIWIPDLNFAIEYQGLQHDNPVEYFGGELAFLQNKKRDLNKKVLSEKNNVTLIEVRPGYVLGEVLNLIKEISGLK